MHPQSLFSIVTSRRFIPFFVIFVVFFGGVFLITSLPNARTTKQVVLSPTPIPLEEQKSASLHNNYTIQIPKQWQPTGDLKDPYTKQYSYSEGGQNYQFSDNIIQGQTFGEPALMGIDTIDQTAVKYGGHNFLRQIWIKQGKPVSIHAIPNELNTGLDYFSMGLPPVNTQQYIYQFDQALDSLQNKKNGGVPITPQPTLEGSKTIHLTP